MEKFPYKTGSLVQTGSICEIYAITLSPTRSDTFMCCIPVKDLPVDILELLIYEEGEPFCIEERVIENWRSHNIAFSISENINSHFGDECIWLSADEIILIETGDIESEIRKINVELNSQ